MAESFVNTFKRDYVSRMDLSDALSVFVQLPAAFEHFIEVPTVELENEITAGVQSATG